MILRRATHDDVADFTAVLEAAYAPYAHLDLPPVTEGIADDIHDHNVWVAEVDGLLRGGIVLVLGTQAHIANLGVHPAVGGSGIGKALMDQALAAAGAAGHREVQLTTHVSMTRTQVFYRKTGWAETGRAGNKVYFSKQLT